jgi:glycine/serine hydroxymethyltransferase
MGEAQMEQIARWIAEVLDHPGDASVEQRVRQQVLESTAKFPLYQKRLGK